MTEPVFPVACPHCGANDGHICERLPIEDCGCILTKTQGHTCPPPF